MQVSLHREEGGREGREEENEIREAGREGWREGESGKEGEGGEKGKGRKAVVSSRSPSSFKSALQNYVYTHSLSLQPHLSNFCDLLTCFLLFSFFGEGLH